MDFGCPLLWTGVDYRERWGGMPVPKLGRDRSGIMIRPGWAGHHMEMPGIKEVLGAFALGSALALSSERNC